MAEKNTENKNTENEDDDDDDFYSNFESFLSDTKSASNLVESSTENDRLNSAEIDRQNLSEKPIESTSNSDKVEVDLLMANIDDCLVENEVRLG